MLSERGRFKSLHNGSFHFSVILEKAKLKEEKTVDAWAERRIGKKGIRGHLWDGAYTLCLSMLK